MDRFISHSTLWPAWHLSSSFSNIFVIASNLISTFASDLITFHIWRKAECEKHRRKQFIMEFIIFKIFCNCVFFRYGQCFYCPIKSILFTSQIQQRKQHEKKSWNEKIIFLRVQMTSFVEHFLCFFFSLLIKNTYFSKVKIIYKI